MNTTLSVTDLKKLLEIANVQKALLYAWTLYGLGGMTALRFNTIDQRLMIAYAAVVIHLLTAYYYHQAVSALVAISLDRKLRNSVWIYIFVPFGSLFLSAGLGGQIEKLIVPGGFKKTNGKFPELVEVIETMLKDHEASPTTSDVEASES
jgi:hypothetical protein